MSDVKRTKKSLERQIFGEQSRLDRLIIEPDMSEETASLCSNSPWMDKLCVRFSECVALSRAQVGTLGLTGGSIQIWIDWQVRIDGRLTDGDVRNLSLSIKADLWTFSDSIQGSCGEIHLHTYFICYRSRQTRKPKMNYQHGAFRGSVTAVAREQTISLLRRNRFFVSSVNKWQATRMIISVHHPLLLKC